MIKLSSGFTYSGIEVFPKNWKTKKASLKKDWYIYYRFYTNDVHDNPKNTNGSLVVRKGMNHFKTLEERQNETVRVLSKEKDKLEIEGYNPLVIKDKTPAIEIATVIETTSFIKALRIVEKNIKGSDSSKRDLKSILGFVSEAASTLNYSDISVSSVSRKHLKQILLLIDEKYGESPHRYNKVRSYLMILYNELIELELVDANPLTAIKKRKTIERLRDLPSIEARKIIDSHLHENHYSFWVFMNIFFHSGARLTEMMLVKRKDVELNKQCFKIIIKKGSTYKEVEKPIKNIALKFWEIAVANANQEDYIFSKNLKPGVSPIQSYQITKRWKRLVKVKLGIAEDFYSLKHLNLDETSAILDLKDASKMASHTSTAVTKKHYAVNENSRQNTRLKEVNNPFV